MVLSISPNFSYAEFDEKLNEKSMFGKSIINIGDFDGDGITDLAVGAYHDDDGGLNSGAIYILFLNSDGTVKNSQEISDTKGNFGVIESNAAFGNAISNIGDLDGDGIVDLVVGSYGDSDNGYDSGAVFVIFLNIDGTVKSHQKISSIEGNFDVVLEMQLPV